MSPLYALSLVITLLFCGVTLDIGIIEHTKLSMQSAADAAALGAQVSHDQEDSNWLTNGKLDAANNGFTDGVNNVSVSVSEVPTFGTYAGDYDAIQVNISKTINSYFMGSINGGKVTVTAQAVSLMTPCVYITGAHSPTTVTYPLTLKSGSSLGYWGGSSMGCPVYVNKGAYVDSISSLWTNATNIAGSSGSSSISGGVFHQPHYNALSENDPLSYSAACATLNANCIHSTSTGISVPSFSSCTYSNKAYSAGTAITLSPGTYCSSFSFNNNTVTLQPGLYVITGGGTWVNSTVTGNGVTLYFTQKGDGNYGTFTVTNTQMSLSAPTTSSGSSIPTILLMNDPHWVPTSPQDFQFLSGTSNSGDGIYYTIGTGIEIANSNFSATHYMCFDVDNLVVVSAAVSPKGNFTTVPTGNPFSPLGGLVQ